MQETHYIHCKLTTAYWPFMCISPSPEHEKASWLLNARTRAVVNVSNENNEKSRAHYCKKLKKEVSKEFVCRGMILLSVSRSKNQF